MLVFGRRSRERVSSGTFSCINNNDQTQSRIMVNPNRFYTYAYLRVDRTPYYIGKGEGNRAYYKYKNEIKPPKDKSRIIFLKQNLLEEDAFKHEIYMISVFGRKDLGTGILRNRTNGGEGGSGIIRSEEVRKSISESRKGQKWWNDENGNHLYSIECPGKGWISGMSEESKRKNSEAKKGKNNPMYGKSPSKETRQKQRQAKQGKYDGINHPSYGKKYWNDGKGNIIRSVECPGDGWIPGMSEDFRQKQSQIKKGMKWWNDGKGSTKQSVECPGKGWFPGRGKLKQKL